MIIVCTDAADLAIVKKMFGDSITITTAPKEVAPTVQIPMELPTVDTFRSSTKVITRTTAKSCEQKRKNLLRLYVNIPTYARYVFKKMYAENAKRDKIEEEIQVQSIGKTFSKSGIICRSTASNYYSTLRSYVEEFGIENLSVIK